MHSVHDFASVSGAVPVIGKHVLLIDSVIGRILFAGVAVRIFLRQYSFDPYVNGKSVHMVETEKGHAVGNLDADAIESGE